MEHYTAKPLSTTKTPKITEDLLNRLNAQLPSLTNTLVPATPQPLLPDYQEAMLEMESRFKRMEQMQSDAAQSLNAKIKELEASLNSGEETPAVEEVKSREEITKELKDLVEGFNKSLEEWYKKTGCVVNFSWNYNMFKKLEIAGIDYIVYRKDAPAEETIKEILSRGEPA